MNISFRISVLLIMLFAIIAPRCHALSDYAGQGKALLTWDELMQPRVDPSRYFAVPNGGHGDHPAGGYDAPQAVARAKPDQTVKPDSKTDPNPPHIPMVRPPKPQPEVKPEPQVKPDVAPETKHKCWSFKFRPVKHDCTPKAKPDCKHDAVKTDKNKPDHKKSECSKPAASGDKTGCKATGMRGHGLGHRGGHHGGKCGKGRR